MRRAIRHASAGLCPRAALNFGVEGRSWNEFYGRLFADRLLPHLVEVRSTASAGEWGAVAAADARLSDALGARATGRNQRAAESVFDARGGARALRELDKLRAACGGNCLFITAFAVHAAVFNIPLLHAAIAYLSAEWRAARGMVESPRWESLFERELGGVVEPLSGLLARHLGGWAEVA